MATIPSKPTIDLTDWTNGQTRLNRTNFVSGINTNLQNLKTAADGVIDALTEEDAAIATKQPLLVSGTNIKTVNGQTVLGAGDISFDAASDADIDDLFAIYPQKGDIISFDAFGDTTQKRFKVLKTENRKIATLLALDDYGTSEYNSSNTKATFDNGSQYISYENSTLDTLLNTTYYNALASNVKSAIVPTNVIQSGYRITNTMYPYPDDDFAIGIEGGAAYQYHKVAQLVIGNRNCFVFDISDFAEYYEITEYKLLTKDKVAQLFFGQSSWPSDNVIWLRPASTYWSGSCAMASMSSFSSDDYSKTFKVRAMFRINLANINYTIE